MAHTQSLVEFWVKHGSSLCKQISQVLRDEVTLPVHDDEEDRQRLLFAGSDMRETITEDVVRLKKLMEPQL